MKQFGQNGEKVTVVLPVEKELSLPIEYAYKELVLGKVPKLKIVKKKFVQVKVFILLVQFRSVNYLV